MDKTPLESKKWICMALGLGAGIVASVGAVFAGPTGLAVLPTALGFILKVTLGYMGVQGVSDAITASKAPSLVKEQAIAGPCPDKPA